MSSEPGLPLVLKFADWPETDRQDWQRAQQDAGWFGEAGAFAHLRKGSLARHRQCYGQWLSFILRRHPELAPLVPADRVRKDVVEAFMEESRSRPAGRPPPSGTATPVSLRTIANLLETLVIVMRAFAPDRDWGWLALATRRTYRQSEPHALKPPLPVSAHQMMDWALTTMCDRDTHPDPDPIVNAVGFRQALSIGLMIAVPVRLRAFIGLRLEQVGFFGNGAARLHFPAADMKDRTARTIPVHAPLVPWLRLYLDDHRQVLLRGGSAEQLWISRDGVPLTRDGLQSGNAKVLRRAFGVALRPHAFRHVAATSIAEFAPEHAGIIRDILGHATLDMAERHYNRATSRSASARYQDLMARTLGRRAKGK